jgi:hypothetical protein
LSDAGYGAEGISQKAGDSVSADRRLAGYQDKAPGGTLPPRLVSESVEKADHGTVSGKYSDSNDGYSGKSHYENYQ